MATRTARLILGLLSFLAFLLLCVALRFFFLQRTLYILDPYFAVLSGQTIRKNILKATALVLLRAKVVSVATPYQARKETENFFSVNPTRAAVIFSPLFQEEAQVSCALYKQATVVLLSLSPLPGNFGQRGHCHEALVASQSLLVRKAQLFSLRQGLLAPHLSLVKRDLQSGAYTASLQGRQVSGQSLLLLGSYFLNRVRLTGLFRSFFKSQDAPALFLPFNDSAASEIFLKQQKGALFVWKPEFFKFQVRLSANLLEKTTDPFTIHGRWNRVKAHVIRRL